MVSKGLTGVIWAVIPGATRCIEPEISSHTQPSYPAQAGYPVRRGLSALSPASLEYWIVRPSAQLRTRRTMTANTPSPSRGAYRPGFANRFAPNERAQGMPGACCTRGPVCKRWVRCAHEHTGTVGARRHSLRSGFTAYGALSPETNSSCLRHRRIDGFAKPGWDCENLHRFDTSHGCQNHTLLPYASASFVCRAADRSQAKARPAIRISAAGAAASTAFPAQRP